MNIHLTEQEEIEQLKRFWHPYGKIVLILLIIGLGMGYAWQYWKQYQKNRVQQASLLYQQLLGDFKKPHSSWQTLAQSLIQEYPKTPYASLTQLIMAKYLAKHAHYAQAIKTFHVVIHHSDMPSLREWARIDLARVLLQQKKTQQALNLLSSVDDQTFLPMINQIKGDAYLTQKQFKKARQAYQKARKGYAVLSIQNPLLMLEA